MSNQTISIQLRRISLAVIAFAACAMLGLPSARADGFIIIDPPVSPAPQPVRPPVYRPYMPLTVKYHHVRCDIREGTAVTTIDQAFYNGTDRPVEGTYIFPLDPDCAVSTFSMYIDGREVTGRLLDADAARREYESIVARMRDPALLEYAGTGMYRARVFPIPPKGTAQVKLSYAQTLATDNGLVRYMYPLNTEKFSAQPIDDVSVVVNVNDARGIKSIFSTSHDVATSRPTPNTASASFEASHARPDTDFVLYYSLGGESVGLTVLAHRLLEREDGYFLARLSPPALAERTQALAKDVCFIIDVSGSMNGAKIEQARRALDFCVNNLGKEDRFTIISFSHEPVAMSDDLVSAAPENVANARQFIAKLRADGGTNVHDALLAGLAARKDRAAARPYIIVFLTDGQPTVGVTDENKILLAVKEANAGGARLFVFGVGDDVNTRLLDVLAEKNGGAREYIGTNENIEMKLSSFYRKVASPVLADLRIDWGDMTPYDVFPKELPDLFAGGEVVIVGRYRHPGSTVIEINGHRGDESVLLSHETSLPAHEPDHDFLPRVWAVRKIGYLLDQIRQNGESDELKSAVVELAKQYGIVTPYTSYLVREEARLADTGQVPRHVFHDLMEQEAALGRAPAPEFIARAQRRAGRAAVQDSATNSQMRDAKSAGGFAFGVVATADALEARQSNVQLVQQIGRRVLFRQETANAGDRWIEGGLSGQAKRRQVRQFSEEYFALARSSREVARLLAQADLATFEWQGEVIEIVPPGDNS